MLIGVNFDGIKISDRQNRQSERTPPLNYIADSFKIFAENGLNCVRVPFYWESFEKDPPGFMREIELISEEADKNGLLCIYDNHQWECSSFLGQGIGFPNSLLSHLAEKKPFAWKLGNWTEKEQKKLFWNSWWDRLVSDENMEDGWNLQRDFVLKVIDKVNNNQSTYGFEILNEPQVYRSADFKKVSYYHDFMIDGIARYTEKPIYYSYTYSNSFESLGFPWRQSKIRPSNNLRNNMIYDVHPYPPYRIVLLYYKLVASLMKSETVFAGEYNSGVKENTTINQKQHSQCLKNLFDFAVRGATFWWWTFEPDEKHPAFNLTKISENHIQPSKNFEYFCKSIKTIIKQK